MTSLVLALSDPNATLEIVGGKGMSLARMLSAGLPVPGGFHVTTEAYRRFVAQNGIEARILQELDGIEPADPTALEAASCHIGDCFAAGETPHEVAAAVSSAYAALKDAAVAVRSSATAEDLPEASFAGQQETYLNIRGTDAVLEAVKKCWASLWTARAIAYRLRNAIDQEAVALAVVVQDLVPADAAGIMFTANPISGKRDELVINAAWGLGEAVVSGAVTPDTIVLAKAGGRVIERQTAEKSVMTVRTEQGIDQVPVPDSLRKQAVLTAAQTAQLARLGVEIEHLYGMPIDIEWVLAGDRFSIVQARPITALPPDWKPPEPKTLFTRGSLAEHTPSPATPLFATLGLEMANEASALLWERMAGRGGRDLIPGDGIYQTLNGYVYLGIRVGGRHTLQIVKMSVSQLGPMLRGGVARWQAARQELATVVEEWEGRPVESFTPSGLLDGVRAVLGAALRY
jgi:phosphoenolpyruvate synthase/pyruvate phosphate dikinase